MLDSATTAVHEPVFAAPETTSIRERIIVAPTGGRFVPLPPEEFTSEGEWIEEGQALAEIATGASRQPVRSPFTGWVMGMLAMSGQPVHQGEALFWVRAR